MVEWWYGNSILCHFITKIRIHFWSMPHKIIISVDVFYWSAVDGLLQNTSNTGIWTTGRVKGKMTLSKLNFWLFSNSSIAVGTYHTMWFDCFHSEVDSKGSSPSSALPLLCPLITSIISLHSPVTSFFKISAMLPQGKLTLGCVLLLLHENWFICWPPPPVQGPLHLTSSCCFAAVL